MLVSSIVGFSFGRPNGAQTSQNSQSQPVQNQPQAQKSAKHCCPKPKNNQNLSILA